MKRIALMTLLAPLVIGLGCTFYARDPDAYQEVTRELVETKDGDIKDCYDVALETNETVKGTVVVNFTVEKKTGKIMNPMVDTAKSDAPPELGQCVVRAVDGLVLDPPDAREGQASFVWNFEAGPPKSS